MQPDGKIIVSSGFSVAGGAARPGVARFNPDGSFDPSFDPPASEFDMGWSPADVLIVQPNGRIIVGKRFDEGNFTDWRFIRMHPDGKLDVSFRSASLEALWAGVPALVLPNGRMVITTREGRLQRLASDGSVDPSFNPAIPGIQPVAAQGEKLLVTGGPAWLSRLNEDGSLDSSFRVFRVPEANPRIDSVFVDASGNILISGDLTLIWSPGVGPSLIRLKPGGEEDDGYFCLFCMSGGDLIRLVALLPTGEALASLGERGGSAAAQIVRLRQDGSVEAGSPRLGRILTPQTRGVQPDGSFVIIEEVGWDGNPGRWLRLKPDLTLDPNFNPPNLLRNFVQVDRVWLQADGKVLAEWFWDDGSSRSLARFTAEGTLDAEFRLPEGIELLSQPVQSEGRLFATSASGIIRLNPDAAIDANFAPVPKTPLQVVAAFSPQVDGGLLTLITSYVLTNWVDAGGTQVSRNRLVSLRVDRIPSTGGPGQTLSGELPVDLAMDRFGAIGARFLPDGGVVVFGSFTQIADH